MIRAVAEEEPEGTKRGSPAAAAAATQEEERLEVSIPATADCPSILITHRFMCTTQVPGNPSPTQAPTNSYRLLSRTKKHVEYTLCTEEQHRCSLFFFHSCSGSTAASDMNLGHSTPYVAYRLKLRVFSLQNVLCHFPCYIVWFPYTELRERLHSAYFKSQTNGSLKYTLLFSP